MESFLFAASPVDGSFALFEWALYTLKVVAVAGGALVGGLTTRITLAVVTRLVLEKALPRPVRWPLQLLGAAAVGWGVWWAFGFGGGLGLGGGFGPGGPAEAPTEARSLLSEKSEDKDLPPPVEQQTLHIVLLGGDRVQQARFYRIEGEQQIRSLAELKEAIRTGPSLKGIEMIIFPESVAQDHPAVRELEKWAKENNLAVSFTFPKAAGE